MKKSFFALIAFTLLLSVILASCKSDDEDEESSSGSSSSKAPSSSSMPSSEQPSSSEPQSDIGNSEQSSSDIIVDAKPIDGVTLDMDKINSLEKVAKGWGMGKNVDSLNRPTSCDIYQKKYGEYNAVFIGESTQKAIYLTFDEGYENGYTPKILDALKEKDCHAVFFVTMDYVKRNEALVRRMIDEGHIVGNHSTTHPSMPKVTAQQAIEEITKLHNYVVEKFDYQMTLFRPPMGEWSTQTLEITKQLGYKTIFWSFAYVDWDPNNQMGVDKAFPKATNAIHPGAVYLLHAVSKDNTEMLGDFIDDIRGKGYSFELIK